MLSWDEARYLIGTGTVTVDAADPAFAFERHVNSVASTMLADRGVPCLHGLVVGKEDDVVGVLAKSGSGKSTTGLALTRLDYGLVTDDLIGLDDGTVRSGPSFVRIDQSSAAPNAPLDAGGKVRVFVESYDRSTALKRLVVLDDSADVISQLHGFEAIDALLNNVYNPIIASEIQGSERIEAIVGLAASIPIFVVPAKSDTPERMAATIAALT